ncbi:acetyltransferase [Geoglobus acetivorans]|uniref:Transferase, putative n=1 Tax=Geoglobus acetivorans TaxID=565033 RepID=A0A0A7GDQ0_GEOAI|nr:transferase, putative [Geoglobus acetivorans]
MSRIEKLKGNYLKEDTKKLIIIGDSAFAQIAYEYFTYDSPFNVVAFSVDSEFIRQEKLFGLPVVPFEELEEHYDPAEYYVFVAIAYTRLNRLRARFYKEAKRKGYRFASYVSSHAFVWRNVELGENCFIFEDNTIQPFVKIGNNVVIWSGNHIGHHSKIRDHVFISSHVVVSGFVEIGEYSFLGVNSTIVNNIKIAKDNVLGAGAVIIRDTEAGKVYVGNPARPLEKSSYEVFNVRADEI